MIRISYTGNESPETHLDNAEIATLPIVNLADFLQIIGDWESKAQRIVITNISQKDEMEMARKGRLYLQKQRTTLENKRKAIKAPLLEFIKELDGNAGEITNRIKKVEEYLKEQETFADRYEAEQKSIRKHERMQALAKFNVNLAFYDLENMSDTMFVECLKIEQLKWDAIKNAPKPSPVQNDAPPQTQNNNPTVEHELTDKDKITGFLRQLMLISYPKLSAKNQHIVDDAYKIIYDLRSNIQTQLGNL